MSDTRVDSDPLYGCNRCQIKEKLMKIPPEQLAESLKEIYVALFCDVDTGDFYPATSVAADSAADFAQKCDQEFQSLDVVYELFPKKS